MKLEELEFKAEDIRAVLGRVFDISGRQPEFDLAAEHLNRILREKLEKAMRVFGQVDPDGTIIQPFGMLPAQGDTHTAKLVCIEEIT